MVHPEIPDAPLGSGGETDVWHLLCLLSGWGFFGLGFVAVASRQQLCGYFDIGRIVARFPIYDYGCFVCAPSHRIVVGNVDCDDLFPVRYIAYIE